MRGGDACLPLALSWNIHEYFGSSLQPVSPCVIAPAYDPSESLLTVGVQGRGDAIWSPGTGRLSSAYRRRQELPLCGSAQMDVFVAGWSPGQGRHGPSESLAGSKATMMRKRGLLRKPEGKASWVSGNPIMNL